MYEHTRLVLCWTLLGCGSDSLRQQQPPVASTDTTKTVLWKMVGRATPNKNPLPQPPPFSQAQKTLAKCKSKPCAAEKWFTEGKEATIGLRDGDTYYWGEHEWPATWRRINGTLKTCLVDPLFYPPGQHFANTRYLIWETHPKWILHLNGVNLCGLQGVLVIKADGNKIWTDDLFVDGTLWTEGGRELAKQKLLLELIEVQNE